MNTNILIQPITKLLKSKRFIVFVIALVANVLVARFPELGSFRNEIIYMVTSLALVLIGGYSLEDAVTAYKAEAPLVPATQEEIVKGIADEIVKEIVK